LGRETLKLATFNLLNLRMPGEDIYNRPGYTPEQFAKKVAWIGAILDRIAADVVIFQEVFSEQALLLACQASRRFSQHAVVGAPHAKPGNELPRLGFASVLPLLAGPDSFEMIPPDLQVPLPDSANAGIPGGVHGRFSRPVLGLTVNLAAQDEPQRPMRLLGVHLKSRRPELLEGEDGDNPADELRGDLRSLIMRGAEAAGVRRLVIEATRANRQPLAVLGDFNDALQAVSTEIITGSAPRYDKQKRDTVLYSAHGMQGYRGFTRDVAYSHVHQADPQIIDHVLLSEEFMRDSRFGIGEVVKVDYYNDHLNDRDPLTSDHAVVVASLRLYPQADRDAT
jgi:Endonuclease/Exonuclease/phosphatase family